MKFAVRGLTIYEYLNVDGYYINRFDNTKYTTDELHLIECEGMFDSAFEARCFMVLSAIRKGRSPDYFYNPFNQYEKIIKHLKITHPEEFI